MYTGGLRHLRGRSFGKSLLAFQGLVKCMSRPSSSPANMILHKGNLVCLLSQHRRLQLAGGEPT